MKTTLKSVQARAMKDPKFFKALLDEPERALTDNKMQLAPADQRRLRQILSLATQTVYVDLESLMRRARRGVGNRDGLFWLAMWAPDISMFPGMPMPKIPKPKAAASLKKRR